MKKESKEKYILLSENKSVKEFILNAKMDIQKYTSDNVVVDLSMLSVTNEDLAEVLSLSNTHKQNGMSFVVLISDFSIEEVDEGLTIAPTLLEAEDVITMENLERELGF